MNRRKALDIFLISTILLLISIIGFLLFQYVLNTSETADALNSEDVRISSEIPEEAETTTLAEIPSVRTEIVLDGLNKPWDIVMIDEDRFLFNERSNNLYYFDGQDQLAISPPDDVLVRGEGGMLGMAIDPAFNFNSYLYTCYNTERSGQNEVIVVRWEFDENSRTLNNRKDLVTGIDANDSGRHSGCQLEFGPENYLWVGTGDAALSFTPQDPQSLAGKILRIDRDGNPAPGNQESPFDERIFSYGHRNVQGLGFFSSPRSGVVGISIEHGPDRDDEINPLTLGNFGWDPLPNYGEGVPMTDLQKFPDAIPSIWSSGFPTIATSGGTIIQSDEWGAWDQAIVAAAQKGSRLLIVEVDEELNIIRDTELFENQYGRIRTSVFGKDNALYLLTDNGNDADKVVRVLVE